MTRYNNNNYPSYYEYLSFPPVHLCFFVIVLFLFLGFSWYISYESMFEDLMDQFKLFLMICPVFLLLLVHFLSSHERQRVPLFIPLPENKDSFHRAGGSPWGVAALLIFLMFMISYHSSFQEKWFPLLSR